MTSLSCSIRIRGTQRQVFDAITDLEHAADRISGIDSVEVLTDGPMAQGTRWRETRVMFGKQHTEEMEVVEFNPPHSYRVGAENCGCLYDTSMTVTPDGDEMILEMSFVATPVTFMAKVMSVVGKLMMGPLRKAMNQDLADIKSYVEGAAPTEP
jgi:carbon monoxide dehydrogenase subunit G